MLVSGKGCFLRGESLGGSWAGQRQTDSGGRQAAVLGLPGGLGLPIQVTSGPEIVPAIIIISATGLITGGKACATPSLAPQCRQHNKPLCPKPKQLSGVCPCAPTGWGQAGGVKREGGLFCLHLAVWPQVSLEPLWISASHTVRDTGLGL